MAKEKKQNNYGRFAFRSKPDDLVEIGRLLEKAHEILNEERTDTPYSYKRGEIAAYVLKEGLGRILEGKLKFKRSNGK